MPERLAYLREWLYNVHGTSGVTMDGFAPVTVRAILDWASGVGIHPLPTEDEMSALRMLDAILITASRPKVATNTKPPTVDEVKRQARDRNAVRRGGR